MGSIQFKSLRRYFFCGLTLLVLVRLARAADAPPNLSPSAQYPGPWLEVTQEIREVLAVRKVSACSQAVGRQSSRNPGEYLLYCTRDGKFWTSWRVQPAAQKVDGPGDLFEGIPLPDRY
jgi:hypothetical protein